MFEVDDISLQASWHLSLPEEQEVVDIKEDERKNLSDFDLLAIHFLYQNYKKNYKGAILNEQNGFNMQLQVAVFLNIMFRYIEQKFLILVITPDYLRAKWNEYFTQTSLKTVVVNPKTCPQDFDDKHGVVLIISFNDFKLLDSLVDYNFFSIIIDCFDEVAKKPTIKRLSGDFHIGLTTRNFYFQPDQRLQWIMLDWCSPDCCGSYKMFCKNDNDNFANFRNNYRHWWFRLTRHFCESLKDIVVQEEPPKLTNYRKRTSKKSQRSKRTKKAIKSESEHFMETESNKARENENEEEYEMSNRDNTDLKMETQPFMTNLPLIDHDDPINLLIPKKEDCQVKPLSDEHSIKNEDVNPSVVTGIKTDSDSNHSEDILLSLISEESKSYDANPEKDIFIKKEELSSQIFSEQVVSPSIVVEKENGGDILLSLID